MMLSSAPRHMPAPNQPASAPDGVGRLVGAVIGIAIFVIGLAWPVRSAALPPNLLQTEAPVPPGPGPHPGIECPIDAVDIWPGTSIPPIVDRHPAGTTFCLRAGLHSLTSSITPKTGNTFIGEYRIVPEGRLPAILDGTNGRRTMIPRRRSGPTTRTSTT